MALTIAVLVPPRQCGWLRFRWPISCMRANFVWFCWLYLFINIDQLFRTWLPNQSSLRLARLGNLLDVPLNQLGPLQRPSQHMYLNRPSYFFCSMRSKNIQGAFFNCSAQISLLKRKHCSTNRNFLYIENSMEQNLWLAAHAHRCSFWYWKLEGTFKKTPRRNKTK